MAALATASSVLIVDAEPYICRVFAAKLTKEIQFLVSSASNGSDAYHAALQRPYDVILWDMRLRETTSVLPSLRALCPQASLILSTTDDRPTINSQIGILDVSDILVKPFGLDTFVDRVREALTHNTEVLPGHSARMDVARIGQNITIETANARFDTRVLEGGQDTFSIVGRPRVDTPPDFEPGLSLKVHVMGEDGVYSFRSRLIRERSDSITLWDLQMPRTIQRSQRRKSPRLPLHLPVSLHNSVPLINPKSSQGNLPSIGITNTTSDLSMGGFALVTNEPLPVGANLAFNISSNEIIVAGSCKVLRSHPWVTEIGYGLEHRPRYRTALRFESFQSRSRQYLQSLTSLAQRAGELP